MKTASALVSLLLLACSAASNADDLSLTASEWRPYVDSSLQRSGFAIYIVSTALERAGYKVSIETGDWPQTLEDTIAGEHDVFATLWFTEERAESLVFSEPYIRNEMSLVRRADSGVRFRKREDLDGLRIGVVNDFAYQSDADTTGIDIVSTGSVRENMALLREGELDLVLADRRVALTEINDGAHAKSFDVLPEPLMRRGLRIGVSKQRQDAEAIVAAFDSEIEKMREDGTFNAILATFRISDW